MTTSGERKHLKFSYDPVMEMYLREASSDMKERIEKYYEEGTMFDIYCDYKRQTPVILSIDRIAPETYAEIEDKETFLKKRTNIVYYCQFPHSNWRDAIQEYEIWNKIFTDHDEERITKTGFLPKVELVNMREDIRQKIKK